MKPHAAFADRAVPPVDSSSGPLRGKGESTFGASTHPADYLHQIISLPNIHNLNARSSNHFTGAGSTLKRGRDATKHPLMKIDFERHERDNSNVRQERI